MTFEHEIDAGELPKSVDAFAALRDRLCVTPEGAAAAFAVALAIYADNQVLGTRCLTLVIAREQLVEGALGVKGFQPKRLDLQSLKERIATKPHVAHSYLQGTSPQDGYALPAGAQRVRVRDQEMPSERAEEGKAKRFVHSTGADSPRPIHLARNNRGVWKATNWGSLTTSVRPPVEVVDDDI